MKFKNRIENLEQNLGVDVGPNNRIILIVVTTREEVALAEAIKSVVSWSSEIPDPDGEALSGSSEPPIRSSFYLREYIQLLPAGELAKVPHDLLVKAYPDWDT